MARPHAHTSPVAVWGSPDAPWGPYMHPTPHHAYRRSIKTSIDATAVQKRWSHSPLFWAASVRKYSAFLWTECQGTALATVHNFSTLLVRVPGWQRCQNWQALVHLHETGKNDATWCSRRGNHLPCTQHLGLHADAGFATTYLGQACGPPVD